MYIPWNPETHEYCIAWKKDSLSIHRGKRLRQKEDVDKGKNQEINRFQALLQENTEYNIESVLAIDERCSVEFHDNELFAHSFDQSNID